VVIASQWHGKHVSEATNELITIEKLWEVMYFVWPVPRLCNEDQRAKLAVSQLPASKAVSMEVEEFLLLEATSSHD
jgi:hypothetical protein